ncbi:MAG: hypothetical protein WAT37_21130 [Saprospiraceae bacterium]
MSSFSKVIIYPKDIALITGKSYRSSWALLQKIRTFYCKEDHQVVTVQEFCLYMGLKMEDVISKI